MASPNQTQTTNIDGGFADLGHVSDSLVLKQPSSLSHAASLLPPTLGQIAHFNFKHSASMPLSTCGRDIAIAPFLSSPANSQTVLEPCFPHHLSHTSQFKNNILRREALRILMPMLHSPSLSHTHTHSPCFVISCSTRPPTHTGRPSRRKYKVILHPVAQSVA